MSLSEPYLSILVLLCIIVAGAYFYFAENDES